MICTMMSFSGTCRIVVEAAESKRMSQHKTVFSTRPTSRFAAFFERVIPEIADHCRGADHECRRSARCRKRQASDWITVELVSSSIG